MREDRRARDFTVNWYQYQRLKGSGCDIWCGITWTMHQEFHVVGQSIQKGCNKLLYGEGDIEKEIGTPVDVTRVMSDDPSRLNN